MPLNALHIGKPARENASRISVGCVVEYEQHGKPLLGVARSEKKNKWTVVNERGQELELAPERIALLPGTFPEKDVSSAGVVRFFAELLRQIEELAPQIELEELWSVMHESARELEVGELVEMVFSKNSLGEHVAMRRALLGDTIFFKRKKTGFEPRPPEVVEELKVRAEVEARRERARRELKGALIRRVRGEEGEIPSAVKALERLAAEGSGAEGGKESLQMIDELREELGFTPMGRPEDRAFEVLVAAKHFSPDQDLNLIRAGRSGEFAPHLLAEAARLKTEQQWLQGRRVFVGPEIFTIDGSTTRDIDDALSLETLSDGFRVGIHISDVASVLSEESIFMREALARATSIYAPDYQIPMLPPTLSEDALSLVAGEVRATVSFFVEIDQQGQVRSRTVEQTAITVTRRMTYEEVDRLLFDESLESDPSSHALLQLWRIVCDLEEYRLSAGALQFNRRELTPVLRSDGRIQLEDTGEDTPARKLVSELMILANETGALFAAEKGIALAFRGQEKPEGNIDEQGLSVPEGPAREYVQRGCLKRSTVGIKPALHSGLGVKAYAQLTSPIRRVADLMNQRQINSFLQTGRARYTGEEVLDLLNQIEPALDEASFIQRTRTKYWLHRFLMQEGIEKLRAVVVRVDGAKPLAEIEILYSLSPFVPAKREGGHRALKPGQVVTLQVAEIHPQREIFTLVEVSE